MACWIILSVTVGIPNLRFPPFGLGISTCFTPCGWYVSLYSLLNSVSPFSAKPRNENKSKLVSKILAIRLIGEDHVPAPIVSSHPDMAEMYRRLQQGYSAPFEAAIRRGIDRGELPADTDVAALAAALIGPLFFRRWFAREPLTEGFVGEIVRIVVG